MLRRLWCRFWHRKTWLLEYRTRSEPQMRCRCQTCGRIVDNWDDVPDWYLTQLREVDSITISKDYPGTIGKAANPLRIGEQGRT